MSSLDIPNIPNDEALRLRCVELAVQAAPHLQAGQKLQDTADKFFQYIKNGKEKPDGTDS